MVRRSWTLFALRRLLSHSRPSLAVHTRLVFTRGSTQGFHPHAGFSPGARSATAGFHWLCTHGRSLPPYALGRSLPPSAGLYRRATAQPQPVFTGCAHASCFILVIILVGFLTIVFDCFLCLVSPCGRAGRCCCFQLLDGAVLRRRCCCCFQLLLRRQSEERRCCFLIYAGSV
jgi:hypothetical protein